MPPQIPLYGFTLLRNGVKYDYCFREALKSLAAVTESTFLALGESEDGTEGAVSDLKFLKIVPTVWDEKLREGGLILSQQTNIALNAARSVLGTRPNAWGIYLQCDEVLHEEDVEIIKRDIAHADAQGCDAVTFRYWHFWQTHHEVAINKKWYPQEIRAIKLAGTIESWGDAQGFRNHTKVFHSDARVFHYGHVRDPMKYLEKKRDILALYHSDEKLPKYKRRERRFDNMTETLAFFGNHPSLMRERVLRLGDIWEAPKVLAAHIVGNKEDYPQEFLDRINAREVYWHQSFSNVPRLARKHTVIADPSIWHKVFHPSHVPSKMRSKLARPWDRPTVLMLKLSEKGIGLKSHP